MLFAWPFSMQNHCSVWQLTTRTSTTAARELAQAEAGLWFALRT